MAKPLKASAFVGVLLVAATAGVALIFGLRSSEQGIGETGVVADSNDRVGRQADTADEPVDPAPDRPESPASQASTDSTLAMRERAMAAALYQATGGRVVQSLTESGLAIADSERIAQRYSAAIAGCMMTSMASEAARQSIPVDQLIGRVGRAVSSGDLNVSDMSMYDISVAVSGVIDVASMETGLMTCWTDAAQEAGISFQSEVEAIEDQLSHQRP